MDSKTKFEGDAHTCSSQIYRFAPTYNVTNQSIKPAR